ncbi:heme exporter protein CcmD [Parasulfuritortus cantonensis]|uniref:Heme exporter protein D n=1 Tax=Parasulfuritortus cantonensis TaxID=2528202 RepID=A0A4R1BIL0_9PROT|nr:heme exporter protein CcmD [Parasulfuritortus cantonensis]TCJ17123.1 heme exporter protein CcmD [Parasulfuritortus cantonensis]
MHWGSWSEFWAMGGYGLYVWGSYGVAFFAVLIEIISLIRGQKHTLQRLRRMRNWESE